MSDVPYPQRHRLPREWYQQRGNTFHVVSRAFLFDAPFKGGLGDRVRKELTTQRSGAVNLLAGCLMPDHLHVIAQVVDEDVLHWLDRFKSYTTNLSWRFGRSGGLGQPDSWDRLIRPDEFAATFEYVMRNPVSAGLVEEVEQWPWVASWVE
ncbi:MAG TPA: hypothetical protein VFY90_13415 [Tepidiformaceae bacterium]|nr:hypothetical protein [Tepidiformaceae bacterium]